MSTGTNKERIEQNNELLNQIKTTIDNLPSAGSSTSDILYYKDLSAMQADKTQADGTLCIVGLHEVELNVGSSNSIANIGLIEFADTIPATAIDSIPNDSYNYFQGYGLLFQPGDTGTLQISSDNGMGGEPYITALYTKSGDNYVRNSDASKIYDIATLTNYSYRLSSIYWESEDAKTNLSPYIKFKECGNTMVYVFNKPDNSWVMVPNTYSSGISSHIYKDEQYLCRTGLATGTLDTSEKANIITVKYPTLQYLEYKAMGHEPTLTEKYAVINTLNMPSIGDKRFVIMFGCNYGQSYFELKQFAVTNDLDAKLVMPSSGYNSDITTGTTAWDTYQGDAISIEGLDNITGNDLLKLCGKSLTLFSSQTALNIPDSDTLQNLQYNMVFITNCEIVNTEGVVVQAAGPKASTTLKGQYYINTFGEKVEGTMEAGTDINDYFATDIKLGNTSFALKDIVTNMPLIDTSRVNSFAYAFSKCSKLKTIPLLDMSNNTSLRSAFESCTSLTTIPLINTSKVTNMIMTFYNCGKLSAIPAIDTSKVTSFSQTFTSCRSLVTVPQLDFSSATSLSNSDMFQYCNNLSDESLNNILASCAGATNVTDSIKTLKGLGLTSSQATRCTTLSNYEAFTAAGWTTGY